MSTTVQRETLRLPPDRMPAVRAEVSAKAKLPRLTSKALKVVLVLNPEELLTASRSMSTVGKLVPLAIDVGGRKLTASVAGKSVRKVLTTLRENGAGNVVLILQGKLIGHDRIEEAGLVAQLKLAKPNGGATNGA
jgi:hypothetical protein